jgi:iron-sulfur cluster repair protein YtfE (RIC family)
MTAMHFDGPVVGVLWGSCGWGRRVGAARLVCMTDTANTTLTDTHDMVVVHRAFRREFTLISPLVRAVPAGDTGRAAVLTDHARRILTGLHLHHTGEDELLWPKLLERCTPDADLVHRMEGQHEQVELHTERLHSALARWEAEARPAVTEEVAATFDALRAALFVHLDEEEREILPLAARHVTQAEWAELAEHGFGQMAKSDLPLMFWMVVEEATPQEAAEMYANVPPPVRLLLRTVFARRYRRYVKRVRTAA